MTIFDTLLSQTEEILKDEKLTGLDGNVKLWDVCDKNCFLMEKETAFELGGFPKESINLILPCEKRVESGCFVIGDGEPAQYERHFSFGKIVILETENVSDDETYEFVQELIKRDSRLYIKGIMTRTSPSRNQINLKVSKSAIANGFGLSIMAETIKKQFETIPNVKNAKVIILAGESPLYKKLLPVAEKQGEITKALNHIFDGIPMDCGKCDMKEVCDEVDGLRKLHKSN